MKLVICIQKINKYTQILISKCVWFLKISKIDDAFMLACKSTNWFKKPVCKM